MSKGKRVAAVYNNQEGEGSRRDYIPERPWKVSNQEPGRNSWTVQTEHNLTPANPDTSPKKKQETPKINQILIKGPKGNSATGQQRWKTQTRKGEEKNSPKT